MSPLPTDRSPSDPADDPAEHAADHNALHAEYNSPTHTHAHPDLAAHDTLGLATQAELDSHGSDTTAIHGIADTSVLATATTLATAVSDHSADTTAVHGIADTSAVSLVGHTHAGGGDDARLILFSSSADQNITGTSVVDITGVSFAVEANSTYLFFCEVDLTASGGATPTHNYQFTGPASPTRVSIRRVQMTTVSASNLGISIVSAFAAGFGAGATLANLKHTFDGVLVNGANAGTVQLRVTPGGTTPTSTIGAGSGGWAMKVA